MKHNGQISQVLAHDLLFLNADQVKRIDQALFEIGEYGEVRLIKVNGKLRFIHKLSSEEISSSKQNSHE